MLFRKRKVKTDVAKQIIMEEFDRFFDVNANDSRKMIIYIEATKNNIVKLHTNIPGIIIGRGGRTYDKIKNRMIKEADAKDIKVIEIINYVSNFKLY